MNWLDLPMHFLRPWWWLALVPLPLVLWMLARHGGGRAALARLADAALLPYLVRDAGNRARAALGLLALGWFVAVVALSGPAWQKVPTPLYVNGAARVVVLSLSNDMLAQDVKPDRMTRARFAVRDLLDQAGDARTALVAYAGAAFTVAPLTSDKNTVLNFLEALRPNVMPVPGNDAAAGIEQGVDLLQEGHVEGGEIVLVTDTAGSGAVDAARAARAKGVRVDVLGIGTTAGAPVPKAGGGFAGDSGGITMARRDDAALRAVAQAGGGRYAVLQADGSGPAALHLAASTTGGTDHGEQAALWRDGGVWLLPFLLVLAALVFRRGWLLVIALAVLPVSMPVAQASTWSSLWSNRDQRALQALERGDAKLAQQLATTDGIRGAADYRAADFASAAKSFAQGTDARSSYNLGNALAKQGEYGKAIAAYRHALKQQPDFPDARANLEAVEAWLKKHPPQSKSADQGQSQSKRQDGQQEQSGNGPSQDSQSSSGQEGSQQQDGDQSGKGQPGQSRSGQGDNSNGRDQPGTQSNEPAAKPSTQNGQSSGTNDAGPSTREAAKQQGEAQRAARDLDQAMQGARVDSKRDGDGQKHAFALGQSGSDQDSPFNAEQRAMLHSVPDDPGALLRRKFRLEWQQRNGRQQEDGER